ncbi:MAG: hypothetical protein IPJ87_12130 [Flavobacteriales bacterium]|nr:hypothetical protein [Flavobacteriales bacterium]MBK7942599.1 hypothetical protein [Flavobacteriales bacterium]MBK8950880.1 hypothetical protein [Flavobacteriales bacterium]MBK9698997.1 hypothetical protein [Flavobacteriales bacterium]
MKGNRPRTPEEPAAAGAAAPQRTKRPGLLAGVLNGSFLTREQVLGNMPFLLFIAGLMLVYIGYGYWTERTVRDLHRTDADLKELRSEYITVRSHLDRTEQQSQVAEDISGLGLRESRVPPRKLTVEPEQAEAVR